MAIRIRSATFRGTSVSVESFVDGARRDLDGEDLGVSVYTAATFRFGELRNSWAPSAARLVLETWSPAADEPSPRVSLSPGEALRLARILEHLVDNLIFARHVA